MSHRKRKTGRHKDTTNTHFSTIYFFILCCDSCCIFIFFLTFFASTDGLSKWSVTKCDVKQRDKVNMTKCFYWRKKLFGRWSMVICIDQEETDSYDTGVSPSNSQSLSMASALTWKKLRSSVALDIQNIRGRRSDDSLCALGALSSTSCSVELDRPEQDTHSVIEVVVTIYSSLSRSYSKSLIYFNEHAVTGFSNTLFA